MFVHIRHIFVLAGLCGAFMVLVISDGNHGDVIMVTGLSSMGYRVSGLFIVLPRATQGRGL